MGFFLVLVGQELVDVLKPGFIQAMKKFRAENGAFPEKVKRIR
jgi:hypothetical protein